MAIHSILKRQTAKIVVHVDGIAASGASIVAMAAAEIIMAAGSYMMIHNPLGVTIGEADEMREYADLLDKMKGQLVNIYAARTKQPAEKIAEMMDAETWLTADEAIAAGFADRMSPEVAMAASLDPRRFNHLPPQLRGALEMAKEPETPATTTAATPADAVLLSSRVEKRADLPEPAAGYDELKVECVGAEAAFLCAQLDNKATLPQARQAWMAEQQSRLAAARKEADEAKAKAGAKKSGVEPLGSGSGKKTPADGGDPIAQFNELVAAKVASGKPKAKALSDAIAENPELHEEYLAAYNAERKQK
jgi:hypothetical protein